MASSVRAFRRNFEPFEEERLAAPWRVAGCTDPVSERRYLLSRAPADIAPRLEADAIVFRCEAAHAIAPDAILPVLEVIAPHGRIEILTAYAAPLTALPTGEPAARDAFASLAAALQRLEAHAFYATALAPGHVGVDESGRVVLLPAAYAIPADLSDGPRVSDPGSLHASGCAAHLAGFVAVAEKIAAHAGSPTLVARVRMLAGATAAGDMVRTVRDAAAFLTGEPIAAREPEIVPGLNLEHVARAMETCQVAEITGARGSGRSMALAAVFARLESDGFDVHWVDEWDLAVPTRRRGAAREIPARATVWLVDDVDERPLLHALLLEHVTDVDRRQGAGLVFATTANAESPSGSFASLVRTRAPRGLETFHLKSQTPAAGDDARLSALSAESRQVAELVAVAACPLPLDAVLSVYPGAGHDVHRAIHELAGSRVLAVETRRLPPTNSASITLRIPASRLRQEIEARIPDARRKSLHRSIARIAEERATFPPMFVYRHLVAGNEGEAAAATASEFVREATRAQREPFLDMLMHDLVDGDLHRSLPYGAQLPLLVRLGDDLLGRGRQSDAERVLTRARDLRATSDDIRAHAPLACEALRLLADAWAGRGQLREALELLEDAREDIAPYLSIAEQARLLNDIGWLHYRLGDYSACVDSCKFTSNTLNPNEHPAIVAQALNLLGVIAFNTSRYDEAVSYYEQSAFLRERENDLNALAGSYNNLALAYQAKNAYDKALVHLNRSIDIKRRQSNEAGLAGGYLNMALLYLEVHNFDEAERKCRESLRISSELGLAQLVAENHNTLGDIAITRGQLDEAEGYYLRALEHAQRLSTVNEEMGAQKRLAKLYLRRNRNDEARAAIDEAARLAQQVGSRYEQAQTEDIFGDLHAAAGRHEQAVDCYEKATTLYATLSKSRLAAACLAKAGLAHANADHALDAKRYLDRAQDLIKSQIGHEIPEEIVTLQQTLRENPLPSGASGTGSQKLMYAFYELASLSDYAEDRGAFVRRVITVFRDISSASSCTLALCLEGDRYASVNQSGEEEPIDDPVLRGVLTRTLQLGTVLHCGSPEIKDILAGVTPPPDDIKLVIVPMKSQGKDMGCVVMNVDPSGVPQSKEDEAFLACLGRHVAGAMRLSMHLAERTTAAETLERGPEGIGPQAVDRIRYQSMIGRDESMRKIFRTIEKIKDMETGILIFGESGTGKTELARTIHSNSLRRRHTFQSIHCAEIPPGLLESELFGHERGAFTGAVQRKLGRCEVADGGTVFLDDVNVMTMEIQARLLQYLDHKSFTRLGGTQPVHTDVRIIAASNENLEMLVKEGRFREDLFYRLKVVQIELPPLRERKDDMILIAQEFLRKRCSAQNKPLKRLSSETIKLFHTYRWPGNVRELQNVLEQIVLLCDDDIVEPSALPEDFLKRSAGGGRQRWQSLEQLAQQMVESGGYSATNPLMPQVEALLASKMSTHMDNKTRAASLLGITKPTLYSRLRALDRLK